MVKTGKVYIAGFQPSAQGIGGLTIGNYLGSIKPLLQIQQREPNAKIYVFVADLHALTIPKSATTLQTNIQQLFALFLACGLKSSQVIFFQQSEIPAHSELAYLLLCHTSIGQLKRMTQFKTKAQQQVQNQTQMIPTGLLIYPGLMAADILLYDVDFVVTGHDQQQHIELVRDLANRFNHFYQNPIFKLPTIFAKSAKIRIMSLKNPEQKMSKTDPDPMSFLLLLDSPDRIKDKIRQAITDSENKVYYNPAKKPGISNLMQIYAELNDQTIREVEANFKFENYQKFKALLTEVINNKLSVIKKKYEEYQSDFSKINQILIKQKEKIIKLQKEKLKVIKNLIGLT